MAGVAIGSANGGKRNVDQEVNMVPFIDLLLVTISFLLVTAVWTSLSRIQVSSYVPGNKETHQVKEPRALHVRVEGKTAALSWQRGTKTDDIVKVPLADLDKEILRAGAGVEPGTPAIVHVPNAMSMAEVTSVLDSINGCKAFAISFGT